MVQELWTLFISNLFVPHRNEKSKIQAAKHLQWSLDQSSVVLIYSWCSFQGHEAKSVRKHERSHACRNHCGSRASPYTSHEK
jgi:hypothetical protein